MEIIDILLKYFLDSSNCRRRADILVKKGMLYRARGMGGLEICIHSLSEAIESIVSNVASAFQFESKDFNVDFCLLVM